ncbi:hypothetical protein [Nonomuraea insulae]|uniref:Uncharacterized protein n=1 Tax=Nonomuraea insulae TaxID=1616787 RepID=A0ABW1CRS4_9ACTN
MTALALGTSLSAAAEGSAPACTYRQATMPLRVFDKFVPPWVRQGNKDFSGHGLRVQVWAQLRSNQSQTALSLWVTMIATETRSDWTKVNGTRSYPFYTAPPGYRIRTVTDHIDRTLNRSDFRTYTDIDHADDVMGPGVTSAAHPSFVQQYRVTGDTNGIEAGSRTGVTTTTKGMVITSRRCT